VTHACHSLHCPRQRYSICHASLLAVVCGRIIGSSVIGTPRYAPCGPPLASSFSFRYLFQHSPVRVPCHCASTALAASRVSRVCAFACWLLPPIPSQAALRFFLPRCRIPCLPAHRTSLARRLLYAITAPRAPHRLAAHYHTTTFRHLPYRALLYTSTAILRRTLLEDRQRCALPVTHYLRYRTFALSAPTPAGGRRKAEPKTRYLQEGERTALKHLATTWRQSERAAFRSALRLHNVLWQHSHYLRRVEVVSSRSTLRFGGSTCAAVRVQRCSFLIDATVVRGRGKLARTDIARRRLCLLGAAAFGVASSGGCLSLLP